MRTKKASDLVRLAILGLILFGFLARVWRIGYQSLWLDEALSVTFAGASLPQLLTNLAAQDIHPPLYYVLLHFWMRLAGRGEFSVRFLSLLLGLPSVPATYALAHALFDTGEPAIGPEGNRLERRVGDRASAIGLIGAFLVAFSPFLVYYSQEARMYSALVTFSVLSSYALWKYLARLDPRWLGGYVAFTAALLYTQYFGGLVVLAQVLYLLGLLTRRRGAAVRGLAGVVIVGACYLPWAPSALSQVLRMYHAPDFWQGQLSLTFLLEHIFGAFALGQYAAIGHYLPVAVVAALVLLGGLALLARRAFARGGGELFLLIYLLVPLVVLYAILAKNPKFTERYLIMIVPPFYLVFALALVDLTRWIECRAKGAIRRAGLLAPLAIAVVFLGVSFGQLWQVYYGPGYRKEDNRGAASYISQHYQPGDVVILMMDPYSFPYYSDGRIPAVPLQPGDNMEAGANGLNAILTGHKRAWLLLWNADFADPTGFVRNALDSAYPQTQVAQFNGLGLKLFAIDHPPHFSVRTTPEHAEPVDFGNRLQLLGYDLPGATVSAGQTGTITLYWKALRSLDRDYIVSLRLTDGRFYYWRNDRRPAADTFPTTS
ncbi:MAG: glycosyltransferase family 39 protein, partial [Chloroflexota bacterium]